MSAVHPHELPADALLATLRAEGAYTDCYAVEVPGVVTLAEFVTAFYTTPLFRLERWILAVAVRRPSTDAEAASVARGERANFAAWSIGGRTNDQLLMRDFAGRTCSWFKVEALGDTAGSGTRLLFGSAVIPKPDPRTGESRMGAPFSLLLPFHRLYSVLLLGAARKRLAA
jgi:hypothetical protein